MFYWRSRMETIDDMENGKEQTLEETCLKGQTLIKNKPSISEGYFYASPSLF